MNVYSGIKCDPSCFGATAATIAPGSKCTWGITRIKRFIARYVNIYRKKTFPNRTMFLAQLEEIANENGIKLPTQEEMQNREKEQKSRLISAIVDANDTEVSTFKYYFDGSNVVAYIPGENAVGDRELHEKTKWDDVFSFHYAELKKKFPEIGMKKEEKAAQRDKIEVELVKQFYEYYDYDDAREAETCPEFIHRKVYNTSAAYSERKKRFYRKKDQTRWTAWWTITYSDEKFASEEQFRKTLLNKFRNLSVRRKWRIMGVFEHGEDNGRLHFHGFFYIPNGKEIGELVERTHYSKKRGCLERYIANTEFERLFGVNQYEDIGEALRSDMNAMAMYTTKMLRYMEKGETVFYSRHIPTEFLGEFRKNDMLIAFCITCKRKIKRYVMCPDVFKRTDTTIERKIPLEWQELYDIGLIDE